MRSLLGRFHRPMSRGLVNNMLTMNNLGDGSTLSLDFTTMGGVLDPRLTFSRAGGGTYVGPDGYIYGVDSATSASLAIGTGSKSVTLTATAGVNRRFQVGQTVYFSSGANNMNGLVTAYDASTQVITINATATTGSGSFTSWFVGNASPRFDYSPTNIGEPRGLLVEGQTANLCRRSNDFNNTVTDGTQWQGSGYTFGTLSTTLPDGSTGNACRLSITSGSGSMRSAGETVVASTVYTWSFWARNNGGSQARFRVWNVIAGSSIIDYTQAANNYVSQIGGANNTSSVWVRVSVTFTTPVGCTSVFVYPCSSDSGTVDLLVWGAQLELGSGASSLIPTGASQVTRSADSCVMTGTNFSSWSNLLEGTFLCNFQTTYSGNTPGSGFILSFDSSGSKRIIYLPTASNLVASYDGTSIVFAVGTATGVLAKVASSYNQSNRSIVLNGGTVGTGTVAAGYLSATSLGIGTGGGVNAHFKQVKFYPTALPNAQLQALTAP